MKERARLTAYRLWTVDLILTTTAFLAAWWIRSELGPRLLPQVFPTELFPLSRYLGLLPLVLAIWTVLLVTRETYTSRRAVSLRREAVDVAGVVVTGTLALAAAGWLLRLHFVSRPFLVLFAVVDLLLLVAGRLLVRRLPRPGPDDRTILVVGINDRAAEVAKTLEAHAQWGLEVVGFVATDGEAPQTFAGRPVLGRLDDLETLLRREVVDEVIFAVSRRRLWELEDQLLICAELGVLARVALPFPHLRARAHLDELEGMPMLAFSTTPGAPFARFLKQLFDRSAALLGLILLSPLLLVIALVIKLTSRGPVLFRQVRCGLNGRRFTLLKYRTMTVDAEDRLREISHLNEIDGPAFKSRRDPRVTPIGRLLRRFSLDELPQLYNVLRGDMSLVGPRPPIPEEVDRYQRWQRRRLSMKPGLTGLWQVSGRADIDRFDRWTELDLAYIDSWSLWLDLKILARTIPAVLLSRGAS